MSRARAIISAALPIATLVATVMAGGIARAQTMGEYAGTTAMSTASKPAAEAADPTSNLPGGRTWETNPWGGSFTDRVGSAGGSFSKRASGGDDGKGMESRWPGTALRDDAGGDGKRFDTGDRFKSDDKRFSAEGDDRFKADENRFPAARFHDDMGLDEKYDTATDQNFEPVEPQHDEFSATN